MIKVFIDQGHNREQVNVGAIVNGINEADLTYEVGIYLASLFYADDHFQVRLSRNNYDEILGFDQSSSLKQRVDNANEWGADLFISLHGNANEDNKINGSEIYVYQIPSKSYDLSVDIMQEITSLTKINDNGIRANPSLYVLRNTKMMALLIELGYLTNNNDIEILQGKPFLFALAIYMGVLSYYGLEKD